MRLTSLYCASMKKSMFLIPVESYLSCGSHHTGNLPGFGWLTCFVFSYPVWCYLFLWYWCFLWRHHHQNAIHHQIPSVRKSTMGWGAWINLTKYQHHIRQLQEGIFLRHHEMSLTNPPNGLRSLVLRSTRHGMTYGAVSIPQMMAVTPDPQEWMKI